MILRQKISWAWVACETEEKLCPDFSPCVLSHISMSVLLRKKGTLQ